MIYIIYKLSIKNYIYIGSTKNFNRRKNEHKSRCLNGKKDEIILYKKINELGGWSECEIVPIEEYDCESSLQARIREEFHRKEYEAQLNTNKAYISKEEKYQLKRDYYKKYPEKKNAIIVCDICNKTYTLTNKSRHVKKHHPQPFPKVEPNIL